MEDHDKSYIAASENLKNIFLDGDHRLVTEIILKEFERYAAIEILATEAGIDIDDRAIKKLLSKHWDKVQERVAEIANFLIGEIVSRSEA